MPCSSEWPLLSFLNQQSAVQARAHALLKSKEAELRTAKEDAQAERAAELAAVQQQLVEASQELRQVSATWQLWGVCKFAHAHFASLSFWEVCSRIEDL